MPHSLLISPQIHRLYKYMTVRVCVKCIEKNICTCMYSTFFLAVHSPSSSLHQQVHV